MKQTYQYSVAPIIEAAISFQVAHATAPDAEAYEQFAVAEAGRYPIKHPVFHRNFIINLGPEQAKDVPTTTSQAGYRLLNESQKQVALVNELGLVFSRLNPYEGWHVFMPEAKRLWRVYREIAKPVRVVRVGLRFINRIDIPAPVENLQEYLPLTPSTDTAIGLKLQGLFSQVRVYQPEFEGSVAITHALVEPPPVPGKRSFILDTDTFKDNDVPDSDEALWDLIEVFHSRKNDIFEASITDKVRELIR